MLVSLGLQSDDRAERRRKDRPNSRAGQHRLLSDKMSVFVCSIFLGERRVYRLHNILFILLKVEEDVSLILDLSWISLFISSIYCPKRSPIP